MFADAARGSCRSANRDVKGCVLRDRASSRRHLPQRLDGVGPAPPPKTPSRRKTRFSTVVEQPVAPTDGVAQGALAGREVARAVREHRQPAIQAGQEGTRRQQPNRAAASSRASGRPSSRGRSRRPARLVGEGEGWAHQLGPCHEHLHGGVIKQILGPDNRRKRRRQRRHGHPVFERKAEHLRLVDHHLKPGAIEDQRGQERRPPADARSCPARAGCSCCRWRRQNAQESDAAQPPECRAPGQPPAARYRIGDRCQRHERDAVGEIQHHRVGQVDRQRGFPVPPGPVSVSRPDTSRTSRSRQASSKARRPINSCRWGRCPAGVPMIGAGESRAPGPPGPLGQMLWMRQILEHVSAEIEQNGV